MDLKNFEKIFSCQELQEKYKKIEVFKEVIETLKKNGYHIFPSDEYGIPDLSDFEGVEVEVRNYYNSKWKKEIIKCKISNNDNCVPYVAADSFLYNYIRPVQEELDFDWDCLPKWANKYIAYSKDYAWYSYDKKPTILSLKEIWYNEGQACLIPKEYAPKNFKGSFMESLFKNPKYKEKE